jgi:hypothetical protein
MIYARGLIFLPQFRPDFCILFAEPFFLIKKLLHMKKLLLATLALTAIFVTACRKDGGSSTVNETDTPQSKAAADNTTAKVFYDFVVTIPASCTAKTLTINDCGDASYKIWTSTANCTGGNSFNGTVFGSGNPLLLTNPPTFPNLGATYHIFDNNTSATRDVLSITFYTGYNASHKPTISYNTFTRKFTIVNAGNPAFVNVFKFSYSGVIAPGVIEFC